MIPPSQASAATSTPRTPAACTSQATSTNAPPRIRLTSGPTPATRISAPGSLTSPSAAGHPAQQPQRDVLHLEPVAPCHQRMGQLVREQRCDVGEGGQHAGDNVLRDRVPRGSGRKLPRRQPVGQRHDEQHAPVHADPDAGDVRPRLKLCRMKSPLGVGAPAPGQGDARRRWRPSGHVRARPPEPGAQAIVPPANPGGVSGMRCPACRFRMSAPWRCSALRAC